MAERWSFCRAALNVFGTATSSRRTGPVPVNSSNANVAVAAAPPGKQRQVTMCTKLLLGIGESVQSIYVVIGGFYLNQYLLEVCCMDAGFVGLLQLIVGLFDTFNDPIVGILSDMTRSRWGRRRPWLLFSAPFLAVAYFGLWSGVDVDTPMGLKFAYYLLCYAGVSMGITCVAVAIGSLVPELTTDYDERSEITAVRIMVGYVIGLFCAMIHQFVVGRVVDKQVGYRISGSIFALVMWTASWIAFAGIKEKFVPAQAAVNPIAIRLEVCASASVLFSGSLALLLAFSSPNPRFNFHIMGRAARVIVEKYYAKLTLDFQMNKKITEEVATIPSKRMRNKIAGFTTHLMKRIQRGPVRGISLKLQEEERERRMEYVPDRSEVDIELIQVDPDTRDMLKEMDMDKLPNITTSSLPLGGRR
ncbi:unnamed protein product [Polarella glacialis]|uniref:40S ribosomal protein S17 n=1 Tax=Polarella glacialis TaxID=89957 RepID=A0A813G170_POLGL|nr:unnamed protein product [Polarella glacialis]